MEKGILPSMPQYQSHKKVWALKIKSVSNPSNPVDYPQVTVVFEDERFHPTTFNVKNKPEPKAGWYLVEYEDGYQSFSPADAFEDGYKPVGLLQAAGLLPKGPDLRSFSQAEIDNWFTYHSPTQEQLLQYHEIRTAAKIFAETINRHVPGSADKTAAMRELRGVVMAANLAVACNTPASAPGPTGLPPHQQRVLDEKIALDDKIGKLKAFFGTTIYAGINHDEQDLLNEQLGHMESYSQVLAERIAAF